MIQDLAGQWHRPPWTAPARLTLMPFQVDGARWLLGRESSLLGDDMGLGKTCQAIQVINSLPAAARVVVVCPAGLRINWLRELALWLTDRRRCQIARRYIPSGAGVVLVSYDQLAKFEAALRSMTWDLAVCDEGHLFRNPYTIRARQILGDEFTLPLRAARKIILTGTPMTARPVELWSLLKWLGLRMSRDQWEHTPVSDQRRLLDYFMLRRMKKDVLTNLPPKTRQIVRIAAAGGARAAIIAENGFERAAAKLAKFAGCKFTETSELRRRTAEAKIKMPEVEDLLRQAVKSSGKVVIFCIHRSTVMRVCEFFAHNGIESAPYTGDHTAEERQRAVDRFQGGGCAAFVATIGAGGVGITLTAASHVIFLEEDWDPANTIQAEDRCWRQGQRNAVLVQHVVIDGSIDCREIERQIAKQAIIDQVINKAA